MRAMVAALSVYRAFLLENAVSGLTHISSVSGSSWFLGTAAFSTEFALKMANESYPISELVIELGERYSRSVALLAMMSSAHQLLLDVGTLRASNRVWTVVRCTGHPNTSRAQAARQRGRPSSTSSSRLSRRGWETCRPLTGYC